MKHLIQTGVGLIVLTIIGLAKYTVNKWPVSLIILYVLGWAYLIGSLVIWFHNQRAMDIEHEEWLDQQQTLDDARNSGCP